VLFSDDGSQIWPSKARLHSARRTYCKDWWNPHWRDRILASVRWLADGDTLSLPAGSDASIVVDITPVTFRSSVGTLSRSGQHEASAAWK
jgi:hypothetical protein